MKDKNSEKGNRRAYVNIDKEMADYFDSTRKTRHIAVYDQAGYVSKETAQEVLKQRIEALEAKK